MRIGFDISQTGKNRAGCGYFAENLITQLAAIDSKNHYTLYPTFGDHYWDKQSQHTCHITAANFQRARGHFNLAFAKRFWQLPINRLDNHFRSIDILHSNNFFCPPKLTNTKLIYTLYDLCFLEYPDCSTDHNRMACFDGVFQASLNADRIIAISQFSRQHFLNTFPHYPAEHISVAYPASRFTDTSAIPKPTKLDALQTDKFWLTVGTVEPRKNIKHLLKAYAQLKAEQPTYPLVLAGKQGWLIHDLEKTLADLGLTQDVHVLGYVDDTELQWLYQHCFCLVYPSLFEGFGLPVLEAMTMGAAIITSNVSSLPEVVGKAGILLNPDDVDALAHTMLQLFTHAEYRNQLKSLATEQAKLFAWERTASTVLNLYEECSRTEHRRL